MAKKEIKAEIPTLTPTLAGIIEGNGRNDPAAYETRPPDTEYTTTRGARLTLGAIPLTKTTRIPEIVKRKWEREGRALPVKPTYTARTVAGVEEIHPHNETTLTTDEERAAWAEWQKLQAEFEADQQQMQMDIVFGMGVLTAPPDDGWESFHQDVLGETIPENASLRRMYWLENEAIGGVDDYAEIMSRVMRLSGVPVDEEAVRSLRASFRLAMAGAAPGSAPDPGGAVADS